MEAEMNSEMAYCSKTQFKYIDRLCKKVKQRN